MKLKHKILEEDNQAIKNSGVVICSQYTHLIFPDGEKAIHHGKQLKKVNNKDWEVFNVSYETVDGYYGMPMLGMGLLNCFIRKEDTRKISNEELEALNKGYLGMYGSYTGKDSGMRWKIDVVPIKDIYVEVQDV